MNFKLFTLLFLIALFCMDDADAWRRRRFRVRFRRLRRVIRTIRTVNTIYTVAKIGAAAAGKRSVDEVMPKIDLCDFKFYDLDGNGVAEEKEISNLIEMTGLVELDELFSSMDADEDGQLTLDEFDAFDCKNALTEDEGQKVTDEDTKDPIVQ